MKDKDNFFLRSSSLNDFCIYLKQKIAQFHRMKVLHYLCTRSCNFCKALKQDTTLESPFPFFLLKKIVYRNRHAWFFKENHKICTKNNSNFSILFIRHNNKDCIFSSLSKRCVSKRNDLVWNQYVNSNMPKLTNELSIRDGCADPNYTKASLYRLNRCTNVMILTYSTWKIKVRCYLKDKS